MGAERLEEYRRGAANEPLIRVCDVTRVYRTGDEEVRALDGVSLVIDRGEFVAVMGASGSGKSTLMAVLGCLDRPTSGRYLFEGQDMADASDTELAHIRNACIGFIFQNFNLLPRTSALENVALPMDYAEPASPGREERGARARAALEMMGLAGLEHRTPSRLSGGQQQRVAIARAMVNNPSLILADEPTGNLDSRTSLEIMDKLAALNRDRGITIVLVTHEPEIAAYADRLITMRDGLVIEDRATRTGAVPSPEPRRDATSAA